MTVVSPRPFFFYTPLLVGSTTGVVSPGAIIEPIRDNVPNCDFLRVHCTDVDLENKKARRLRLGIFTKEIKKRGETSQTSAPGLL